jgi:hypothetical protein
MSQVVNPLIVQENKFIENGDVSVQTHAAFNWNVGAFVLIPVITLIGALYWSIVRANDQKVYGGG